MNKLGAKKIGNCITCQSLRLPKPPPPMISIKMPEKFWKAVNMEYLGLLAKRKFCLVLIDQRSRYPIIAFMTSTDVTSFKKSLRECFCTIWIT